MAVLGKAPPRRICSLLLAAFFFGGTCAAAPLAPSREYQIKAAFLFNFARFVEWPPGAFPRPAAPLRIGILGDDPFGAALDNIVAGESIQDRTLRVERSRRIADLRGCQIVFISRAEAEKTNEIIAALRGASVLTVGEADGFAAQGGVIGFYLEGNKVRFEINLAAARRQGLRISSQLLRLGRIVDGPSGPGG